MKFSDYNICFSLEDELYVYNTLTTGILSIPEKIHEALQLKEVQLLEEEQIRILAEHHIIVDDNMDERANYEYYYNSVQYGNSDDELRLVILPTYKCNLRCTYCFEECKDLNFILDEEKIQSLLDFAKEQITTHPNYKRLKLVLFGGEPLLCKENCIQLAKRLNDLSFENNISFISQIITNATCINEDIIKRLILPFNMKIQITVDGDQKTNDKRRIYKSGKGTYQEIKESILLLNQYGCKDLIDLRLNIDRDNLDDIKNVFEEFNSLCGYIYIGLLKAVGNNSCKSDSCIKDTDYLINIRPQLVPILKKANNRNEEYISFGKKRPCALNRKNSFIIDANLDVYKCDNLVGNKKYSVGKIISGKFIKSSEFYKQSTWSPFRSEKCNKCKLLPACASDCAYKCLLASGSMAIPHCAITEDELIKMVTLHIKDSDRKR